MRSLMKHFFLIYYFIFSPEFDGHKFILLWLEMNNFTMHIEIVKVKIKFRWIHVLLFVIICLSQSTILYSIVIRT